MTFVMDSNAVSFYPFMQVPISITFQLKSNLMEKYFVMIEFM